ncbi:MAG TPA: TrkH family potassium uptake protein [Pseudobacteroides sp.]|uniref:TrkH family potassium uptake protein n=1 Tax=Pseudobacteroides sp. TaxID=1968840 RepID=UPI002F92C143
MIKLAIKYKDNKIFYMNPTRLIVLSFILLIVIGGFLLNLPIASKDGKSVGVLGAFFTSTSASCVTGLIFRDTQNQWTIFGQLVILFLIQVGGLGIITLTMFFTVILGRKISLKGRALVQESLNSLTISGALKLLKKVFLITIVLELIGAVLLSIGFVPKFGLRGIYMGVFHSISAFCNAGFDIIGNQKSFTEYNGNPLVLLTISFLIITGGLGFIVWEDIMDFRRKRTFMLHSKIVFLTTAFLLISGSILFFLFEYNNSLTVGKLNLFEKINASVFHSVITRTAGFNSLPLNDMTELSKVTTTILMFIGGAPGSTAGGIKVTTFSIILISIISQVRGSSPVIFNNGISFAALNRAIAIIGLAAIWVIVVTTFILVFEGSKHSFLNILYEVTSAFGTVGLSAANTPDLHVFSKILLMVTMFIGRVGPISFAIAITINNNKDRDKVYPEGKVIVG